MGGEIYFEPSYEGNCLVNAFMTAGLIRTDGIMRAIASGVGNHVVLIGSKTGRDGIGGASVLASQEFDETLEEKRPSASRSATPSPRRSSSRPASSSSTASSW